VDKAPAEIQAILLDEGTYLCSVATMYRLLRAHGETGERRSQAEHPARVKPELIATGPNNDVELGYIEAEGSGQMVVLPPLHDY
jgi:hypothetical protein